MRVGCSDCQILIPYMSCLGKTVFNRSECGALTYHAYTVPFPSSDTHYLNHPQPICCAEYEDPTAVFLLELANI